MQRRGSVVHFAAPACVKNAEVFLQRKTAPSGSSGQLFIPGAPARSWKRGQSGDHWLHLLCLLILLLMALVVWFLPSDGRNQKVRFYTRTFGEPQSSFMQIPFSPRACALACVNVPHTFLPGSLIVSHQITPCYAQRIQALGFHIRQWISGKSRPGVILESHSSAFIRQLEIKTTSV